MGSVKTRSRWRWTLLGDDAQLADSIIAHDAFINNMERMKCSIRLLATQTPVARDLRFVFRDKQDRKKDLERIGDLMINIAQLSKSEGFPTENVERDSGNGATGIRDGARLPGRFVRRCDAHQRTCWRDEQVDGVL